MNLKDNVSKYGLRLGTIFLAVLPFVYFFVDNYEKDKIRANYETSNPLNKAKNFEDSLEIYKKHFPEKINLEKITLKDKEKFLGKFKK